MAFLKRKTRKAGTAQLVAAHSTFQAAATAATGQPFKLLRVGGLWVLGAQLERFPVKQAVTKCNVGPPASDFPSPAGNTGRLYLRAKSRSR